MSFLRGFCRFTMRASIPLWGEQFPRAGNLLVDPYGVLKLIDFEHCRQVGVDESDYWPAGSVAGTPMYMSPEHLTGNLTIESDYFVVGTLLLEHITGSDPLAGPDFASVLKAITKPDASHLVAAIRSLSHNSGKPFSRCSRQFRPRGAGLAFCAS
jgi:serine/threonine protein kinase